MWNLNWWPRWQKETEITNLYEKSKRELSASRLRIEEVEAKSIVAAANNEKALQEAIADGENAMNENMEKALNDQHKLFKSIIESQQDNHRAEFSSLQEKYDAELQPAKIWRSDAKIAGVCNTTEN